MEQMFFLFFNFKLSFVANVIVKYRQLRILSNIGMEKTKKYNDYSWFSTINVISIERKKYILPANNLITRNCEI